MSEGRMGMMERALIVLLVSIFCSSCGPIRESGVITENPLNTTMAAVAADWVKCRPEAPDAVPEFARVYTEELINGILNRTANPQDTKLYSDTGFSLDCYVFRNIIAWGIEGFKDSVEQLFVISNQSLIGVTNDNEALDRLYRFVLGRRDCQWPVAGDRHCYDPSGWATYNSGAKDRAHDLARILIESSEFRVLHRELLAAEIGVDTLLNRLGDLSMLPRFHDFSARQFSSFEPSGGNDDRQHFLRMEGDSAVLAEMSGPGAIVRIWSANAAAVGNLQIFIDDSPAPVIDVPFARLFDSTVPPFISPLARTSSGGFISYLPIPYSHYCKVVVQNPKLFYYQIDTIEFATGTKVRSFSMPLSSQDQESLDRVLASWQAPEAPLGGLASIGTRNMDSGKTTSIANWNSSGRIAGFGLKFMDPSGQIYNGADLRKLILRAWFDDHANADIEAPIPDLFANAFGGGTPLQSLVAGQNNGVYYLLAPMPFGRNARFEIHNSGTKSLLVQVYGNFLAGSPDFANEGYFHAQFFQERTQAGRPHKWLGLTGSRGHFLGVSQTMVGNALNFLEGDEQFRVDSESWRPSQVAGTVIGPWNGTGTEDYFNSAWYFSTGPIALPTHGAPVRHDAGRVSAYRWHFLDAPAFINSIDAQIEHGGTNDLVNTYYSSVVYWYSSGEAPPRGTMPSGDQIDVLTQ